MKIDVQCHVFPEEYSEFLLKYSQFPSAVSKGRDLLLDYDGKQKFLISREKYDIENILAEMDQEGIDAALISCNLPDTCLLPPDRMAEASGLVNDCIREICDKWPDRFYGIASIPWCCPEEAAAEIKRVKGMGFKSVMVFSHAGPWQVDDERLKPLYRLCAEQQLPLTMHPTVPLWYQCAGDYSLIPMLSFQLDSSLALMRLILSGIMDENPSLKVVMPHAGGVLPYMEGRIKYQTEIMKRGTANLKRGVPEHLRAGRIWYDTVSPSVESLRYLYDFTTCDHILFGTDYPFINTRYFIDLIQECRFTPEEQEMIFWKNASEVYDLGW